MACQNLLCRICLMESTTNVSLDSSFYETADESERIRILEAVEKVMSVSLIIADELPNQICSSCSEALKIAYELRRQFENSQSILQKCYSDILDSSAFHETPKKSSEAPVEIIFGLNKFDLNDLVIVEEPKVEEVDYGGFLKNLGKTISAKFVSKDQNKRRCETPVVCIENVEKPKKRPRVEKQSPKSTKNQFSLENNSSISESKSFPDTDEEKEIVSLSFKQVRDFLINQQEESELLFFEEVEKNEDNLTFDENPDQTEINIDQFIIETGVDEDHLKNPNDSISLNNCLQDGLIDINDDLIRSALNMQYQCSHCDKVYSSKTRCVIHMQSCQKQLAEISKDANNEPVQGVSWRCHLCTRKFKLKKYLNYHIKTAHMTDSYTCEICKVTLRNRNSYCYHKLTKHSKENYICQYCGKKFFTSSCLKAHVLVHTDKDAAKCICPICGKTFHYKGGLYYHMKLHTNERKYCCEYCDKRFYTLTSKKRHERTHTGDRPFECKICDKKFSSGELHKHEYVHTDARPYHCKFCGNGFTSVFNMNVHMLTHPGDYSCTVCSKSFIAEDVLRFHHKTKHKEIVKDGLDDANFSN